MRCSRIERAWPAYLAGDLGAWSRRRFERHLVACGACRARRAVHEALRAFLRESLPSPAPIDDAEWRRVLDALPAGEAPRWRTGIALALAGAAATAIVLLALPSPRDDATGAATPDAGPAAVAAADACAASPATPGREERVVVRLATSDPKVKVVWVIDPDLPL